jgi:hypothetical protein
MGRGPGSLIQIKFTLSPSKLSSMVRRAKFASRRNDHVSETADGGHVISCLAENAAALSPSCYAALAAAAHRQRVRHSGANASSE